MFFFFNTNGIFSNVPFNLKIYSDHFPMLLNILFQRLFSNVLISELLLKIIEDLKKFLFMWFVFINIYSISN